MPVEPKNYATERWDEAGHLLRRVITRGVHSTTTRYSFKPGGRFPKHRHSQEQVTYVISGDFHFTIDGVEHRLEKDSLVVVPPSAVHMGEAGPDGAELLAIVAPAREEGDIEMLEED